jgi:hypothetical protein
MPRVVLVVLAVVSLVGVTACGDDETETANTYVAAVNDAQSEFTATFGRLESEFSTRSSVRENREALRMLSQAVDRMVRRLRAARPPANVRSLHQDLIAAISAYRPEVDRLRRAFTSRNPRTLRRTSERFVTALGRIGARIDSTIKAINDRLRE